MATIYGPPPPAASPSEVDALEARVTTLETSGGGGGGPRSYHHVQPSAAAEWIIDHNLGFRPAGILVQDSAGETVFTGDIEHVSVNRTILRFLYSFQGTADLS